MIAVYFLIKENLMLCENIKNARIKKGLSQQELAEKLNVVRQTVSKWEKGQSVPDAELLKNTADVLDVSVNTLLDIKETSDSEKTIKDLTTRLELMTNELKIHKERQRKVCRGLLIVLLAVSALILISFAVMFISEHIITNTSSSIGIIGGADGPTSIIVTTRISPRIFIPIIAGIVFIASAVGTALLKRKKK